MNLEVLADNKRFDNDIELGLMRMEKRVLDALIARQTPAEDQWQEPELEAISRCVNCGVKVKKGSERCKMHEQAYRTFQRLTGTIVVFCLLFLLLGCQTPKPAQPQPNVPTIELLPIFPVGAGTTSLIFSNPNSIVLRWTVEHRQLMDSWTPFTMGRVNPYTNVYVTLSPTNSADYFRAGWVWP